MFEIFKSLTKAMLGVFLISVALMADVVTLGGAKTKKDIPYTAEALAGIMDNIEDAMSPRG